MKKFAPLLMLLLLTACSAKPSNEMVAQQVTAQLLQRHSVVIYEVVNLKKVNGIARDNSHYDAEVEYELRFLHDLKDAAEQLQRGGNLFAAGLEATTLGLTYGNFQRGDTRQEREWVHFVRSEQGWLIDQPRP
jgi:hypothetical protein